MAHGSDALTPEPHPDAELRSPTAMRVADLSEPLEVAGFLAEQDEIRGVSEGFHGYGSTKPGDRVLVVTDTYYDPRVADVIAAALEEKGACVDRLVLDVGPDREFTEVDEIPANMLRGPWEEAARRYEGVHWVEELARREGYDLLVMGRGGPGSRWPTPFRYEQIPWFTLAELSNGATLFPRRINALVSEKVHAVFAEAARGGRVHLSDPEGTDLSWTMLEEYYRPDHWWYRQPIYGHVMGYPVPPISPEADTTGVIAGTTNHFSRPFPTVSVHLEKGELVGIEGGGAYGEAWRHLRDETKGIKYPSFPRTGLFWLCEAAIGTNPKVRPVPHELMPFHSSGGSEKERMRSGAIHMGVGTMWRDDAEQWAAQQGHTYGHLHVHLFFATMSVTTTDGREITVIDNGRLTALGDPEVRALASQFGDPDELLAEEWVPRIPGITAPGDYASGYGRDPAAWIYSGQRDRGLATT